VEVHPQTAVPLEAPVLAAHPQRAALPGLPLQEVLPAVPAIPAVLHLKAVPRAAALTAVQAQAPQRALFQEVLPQAKLPQKQKALKIHICRMPIKSKPQAPTIQRISKS
jgi:hypothetical protein